MADYTVQVIDQTIVVQPFGADALLPLVSAAEASADRAQSLVGSLDVLTRSGPIYSYGAPYIDGTTLRFPTFYQRLPDNAYTERTPSNSQTWFETTVPTEAVEGSVLVYYDAADNSIKTQTVFVPPAGVGADDKPVLGQIARGIFTSTVRTATILANDFDANVASAPPVMGDDTTVRFVGGITALANLGMTLAYSSSDQIAAIGGLFRNPSGQAVFARVFVYDNDASPGTPIVPTFEHFTAAHLSNPSTGLTTRGAGILEKTYSSRLRSYLIDVRERTAGMVGLRAYIDTDARDVFICGLQFAASNQRGAVIPVSDMATGLFNDQFGKMYLPGEIALFDDRKITLYPTNFIDRRPIAAESITLSRGVENFTAVPAGFAGAQGMEVDPARLQNNDTLTIARHFAWPLRNQVQFRDLTVRKIVNADLTGKTVNALFVGDSKFDDPNTPSAVKAILSAKGATVNLRGTLFGYDKDSATIYHEGRSGRSLADYVGKDRTDMAYVSNPATYIAAANFPDKYAYNPFLSTGSGTGSYDGYIFDYAGYLTKYASIIGGTPNIVIVDLGTNDYPEWTDFDAMTDFVDVAITRIITSVRGAGAKVLFTPGAYGWSDYWAEVGPRAWPAFMRGLLRAVNRVNQPLNTRVSSAFAQISPLAFGAMTVTNTDADTGLKLGTRADHTHPKLEARVQFATAIAADIAAMIR